MIFDITVFEETLLSMEIDVKKMPLGKLSKTQIEKGNQQLSLIEEALKANRPGKELADLSSTFYTIIPHHFGFARPPAIASFEALQKKYDMLITLADMELGLQIMQKKESVPTETVNPIDRHYANLNNDITPIDKDGEEWGRINKYLQGTQEGYKLTLVDAFRVSRHGERQAFEARHGRVGKRRLLWHGTRTAVVGAILTTGLKIMPHAGGRVGKGLYFADMVSKSAGYTGAYQGNMVLFLNEVALGNIQRIQKDQPSLKKPESGFDSVLAEGTVMPDPKNDVMDTTLSLSGQPVEVPQGPAINRKLTTSFQHNEYLVYDQTQVTMQYVLIAKR